MKKIFKLTAMLLIAGAMMMTGCTRDPNALPGTWTSTAKYYEYEHNDEGNYNRVAGTGPTYVYTPNYELPEEEFTYPSKPNSFNHSVWPMTYDHNFTGFEATVISTTDSTIVGIPFYINIDRSSTSAKWSYYTLFINSDKQYRLKVKLNGGEATDVYDWTTSEAIKKPTEKNTILVYQDKEGNLIIKINGTQVEIIRPNDLLLKQGDVGIITPVTYEQLTARTDFTSTYQFNKFQY